MSDIVLQNIRPPSAGTGGEGAFPRQKREPDRPLHHAEVTIVWSRISTSPTYRLDTVLTAGLNSIQPTTIQETYNLLTY